MRLSKGAKSPFEPFSAAAACAGIGHAWPHCPVYAKRAEGPGVRGVGVGHATDGPWVAFLSGEVPSFASSRLLSPAARRFPLPTKRRVSPSVLSHRRPRLLRRAIPYTYILYDNI